MSKTKQSDDDEDALDAEREELRATTLLGNMRSRALGRGDAELVARIDEAMDTVEEVAAVRTGQVRFDAEERFDRSAAIAEIHATYPDIDTDGKSDAWLKGGLSALRGDADETDAADARARFVDKNVSAWKHAPDACWREPLPSTKRMKGGSK